MEYATNLENYRVFYEVAKSGNLTKASENLFISQPAVSQTIKKLEEDLGVVLFIRNKRGVVLTRIGKQIFEKVENALLTLSSVENLINDENGILTGELVVGSGSSIARKILCDPVAKFLKAYPNIEVTQIEDVQTNMIKKLERGEVDIVVTQQNESIVNFPFQPITQQAYVFVKKKRQQGNRLRFIKITDGSFAQVLLKKFLDEKAIEDFESITVTGYKMAIEFARLGVGVALVPFYIAEDLLKKGELDIVYEEYALPNITFGYYFNPILATSVTKKFIEFLDEKSEI